MTGAPRRIAITGAGGRLGRALRLAVGADRSSLAISWDRAAFDLDAPISADALLDRDRPDLVIHAAAWTDVDGCARDPQLALARNGTATGILAAACAARGIRLALISTNEVFDGDRSDGRGYGEDDPVRPRNPYGESKLAGETAARIAFAPTAPDAGPWIIRIAWLYGPPGNDFPRKILAAADRLAPGEPLRVVDDEWGTPTATVDLAPAVLALTRQAPPDLYHLAPADPVSRLGWATEVLRQLRPDRPIAPISRTAFTRASDPPPWGVLDATRAAAAGVCLPDWRATLARELATDA